MHEPALVGSEGYRLQRIEIGEDEGILHKNLGTESHEILKQFHSVKSDLTSNAGECADCDRGFVVTRSFSRNCIEEVPV